ncbi:MAG TPA: hypothetical protein VIY08_07775 [Candidatus Nitrosocosmicus sp.]
MKVTDEHVHNSKALQELVDGVIPDNMTSSAIGNLFAEDGAYERSSIFRYLSDNGILFCINVGKNSN